MSTVICLIHLSHLNQDAVDKKCVQSEDKPVPLCCRVLPPAEWYCTQEVQVNGSQSGE
jgi:hypothetical protein